MGRPIYIQQLNHDDCGPAAIKMLCAQLYQQEGFLFLEEQWPRPMSVKAMVEVGNGLGLTLKGYKLHHPSSIRGVHQPFIALRYVPTPHFVTVFPKKRHRYLILDPSQSPQVVNSSYFQQHFSGVIVVLKHYPKKPSLNLSFKPVFFRGFLGWSLAGFALQAGLLWWTNQRQIVWLGLLIACLLLGGWLVYVYLRFLHLDRFMQSSSYQYVVNPEQYRRYHLWKQGWLSLPLKRFYRYWLVIVMVGYVALTNPEFLTVLSIHTLVMVAFHALQAKSLKLKYQALLHREATLMFPLVNANGLKEIQQLVRQVLGHWWQSMILMFALACLLMLGFYVWFPYQDFLTLMTGITLMMVVSKQLLLTVQDREEKQAWRQGGYLFLNDKNYDKVKR
jgi:hypothetical protein